MTDKERIKQLEAALEYAINEADKWHDDCYGGEVDEPEMDSARSLLPGVKWEYQRREEETREYYANYKHTESILTAERITQQALKMLSEKIHFSDFEEKDIPKSTTTVRIRKPTTY